MVRPRARVACPITATSCSTGRAISPPDWHSRRRGALRQLPRRQRPDRARGEAFSRLRRTCKRYNFNLLAHFTVSDAFEPFVEAKWNRVNTLGNNAGPSFIQGTMGQFDARERVRLDNPFLSPAERATIATAITTSGCNTGPVDRLRYSGGRCWDGTGQKRCAQCNRPGRDRGRNLSLRGCSHAARCRHPRREVGARYIPPRRRRSAAPSTTTGTMKSRRTTASSRKTRSPSASSIGSASCWPWTPASIPLTGQIQCRSQFDPAAAAAYDRGTAQVGGSTRGNAGQQARLAADIAACVPYNPFGGSDNSAAVNYFEL